MGSTSSTLRSAGKAIIGCHEQYRPAMLEKLSRLIRSSGSLRPGSGLVSGVLGLALAVLSLLAVLAFHFPEYLTTPELRQRYDVALLRRVLLGALLVAGSLAVFNMILSRARWLGAAVSTAPQERSLRTLADP